MTRATVEVMTKTSTTPGAPARASARRRAAAATLTRRLEQLDVGSDEALELARQGLEQPLGHRFEILQAKVIAAWSAQLAADAVRGITHLDRNEALGEARLWLIEQLKEFRPSDDGGTVGAFIRSRQSWFRSDTRRGTGGRVRTHGEFTVIGAVGRVREDFLRSRHREPSGDELREAATALLRDQARTKILDKADGSGLRLREDELAEAVRRRLSKDGVLAALDDIDEVRREALPDLALQTFDNDEDDAPHWGVPVPSVPGPDIERNDPERDFERLLQVALGDHQWARTAFGLRAGETPSGADSEPGALTLRELAAQASRSVKELRDVLAQARARVAAPHAHFAHLADLRVEHARG